MVLIIILTLWLACYLRDWLAFQIVMKIEWPENWETSVWFEILLGYAGVFYAHEKWIHSVQRRKSKDRINRRRHVRRIHSIQKSKALTIKNNEKIF